MGKQMRSINKKYLGKKVESLTDLNNQMEQIDAYAAVRKIQMISFEEEESEDFYVYRLNRTSAPIAARHGASQIAERVFLLPTYQSTWPF